MSSTEFTGSATASSRTRLLRQGRLRVTPVGALAVAAAGLELCYLVAMRVPYPLHVDAGAVTGAELGRISIGLGIAFVLYVWSWRLSHQLHAPMAQAWIALGALLFSGTLVGMFPIASHDIFAYMMRSHILVDLHRNPFLVPPAAFPGDPWLAHVDYRNEPVPHGPVWVLIAAIPTWLAGGRYATTLVDFKLLQWIVFAVNVVLLWLVLRRLEPADAAPRLLLFAWNPLVLFELVGNGHNDGLMLTGLLAALLALTYGRPVVGLVSLTLAVLVKFVFLLLTPIVILWLWRQPWPRRTRLTVIIGGIVTSGGVAAALYTPFWRGLATVAALDRGKYWAGSPASVAVWLTEPAIPSGRAQVTVAFVAMVVFGVLYVRACLGVRPSIRGLADAGAGATFWYLAVACFWLEPWYLSWLAPLVALSTDRKHPFRFLAFCVIVEAISLLGYATLHRYIGSGTG